jgi:hypothetical protein
MQHDLRHLPLRADHVALGHRVDGLGQGRDALVIGTLADVHRFHKSAPTSKIMKLIEGWILYIILRISENPRENLRQERS